MMLGFEFIVTLGDAIGLIVLAVLFAILIIMIAIDALVRLWEWLTDEVRRFWHKISG